MHLHSPRRDEATTGRRLPARHAESSKLLALLRVLDALGHDAGADLGREGDEGGGEGTAFGVPVDAAGQRDVELDDVGVQADDVAKAGKPGAGIVDGQLDAALAQGSHGRVQRVVVLDGGVLGHLDHDSLGRHPVEHRHEPAR